MPPGETVSYDVFLAIAPDVLGAVLNSVSATVGNPDFSITSFSDTINVIGEADLRLNKFVQPFAGVEAGEQITYTLIVDNLGPSTAQNIVLTDTLVTAGFFQANGCSLSVRTAGGGIDAFDCNFALSTGVFDLATMGANWLHPRSPSDQGRMVITINGTALEGIDLINFSTVTAETFDPDMSNNEATATLSFTSVADLSITKTVVGEVQVAAQPGDILDINSPGAFPYAPSYAVSTTQATAGRRISFTLEIINHGPSRAENVTLYDNLPLGVTIIPGSLSLSQGNCESGIPGDPAANMTCGLGNLGSGQRATIGFQVLVDASLPPGLVLNNDAFVVADTHDDNNANDHAGTQTIINTWADMEIIKLSVGENVTGYDVALRRAIFEDLAGAVTAGRELRYEITVQNKGASDAQNVQILDLLPGQTDTGLDHNPVTFLYADRASCSPMDEQQQLGVFGPDVDQGKFGQLMWCNLGTVPAGARVTFDIYVVVDSSVPDGTTLTNGAYVWWGSSSPPADPDDFNGFPFPQIPPELPTTDDPFLDDNFASTDTNVSAVADVWISKVDVPADSSLDASIEPDLAVAGEEHRYLLTFGNDGPSVAQDIGLQDFLDIRLFDGGLGAVLGEHFVRCEPFDIDDFVSCSESNGVVSVDNLFKQNEQVIPGAINPGESFSFYLVTQVDPAYVLEANDFITTNDSRITATSTDFHTTNNVDAHDTEIVGLADLSITKESEFNTPVGTSGMITYTLTVKNNGPSDAAQVYIVDWLPPAGVILNPADVTVTLSNGQVVEIHDDGRVTVIVGNDPDYAGNPEIGRLNVGSTEIVTIVVYVSPDAKTGTLVNHAWVETRQNNSIWPPAPISCLVSVVGRERQRLILTYAIMQLLLAMRSLM